VLAKKNLYIHLLDEERERNDTVGPYRKSLLYLVSRALEDQHKTPLLGMHKCYAPVERDEWHSSTIAGLNKWTTFWGRGAANLSVIKVDEVAASAKWSRGKITRRITSVKADRGSFDNDVQVVADTIRRITGDTPLKRPVENLIF
jgi:hypothetical protein